MLSVPEHEAEGSRQKDGARGDSMEAEGGKQARADDGTDDEGEDRAVVEKGRLQVLTLSCVDEIHKVMGAAPEIADAHRRRESPSMELAEGLDLHAAGKRRQAVCQKVEILGHKGDSCKKGRLDEKRRLPPMQVVLMAHMLHGVCEGDAEGEGQDRQCIVGGLVPVTVCDVPVKGKGKVTYYVSVSTTQGGALSTWR